MGVVAAAMSDFVAESMALDPNILADCSLTKSYTTEDAFVEATSEKVSDSMKPNFLLTFY